MSKPDLNSKQYIKAFIDAFYEKVLADERLAPIFLDVAEVDLSAHLPIICSYWEKLLLGETDYKRHTMNIHRQLHTKRPLRHEDFDRWLSLFIETVDEGYVGDGAERAKQVARHIAANMHDAVSKLD